MSEEECYEFTVELYEFIFGYQPPQNIWEPVEDRFNYKVVHCSYVDLLRMTNYILKVREKLGIQKKEDKADGVKAMFDVENKDQEDEEGEQIQKQESLNRE